MSAHAVNQLLPSVPSSYEFAWIKFYSCDPLKVLVSSPLCAAPRAAQLQGLHFYAVVTAAAMQPRMELLAHVVDAPALLTAIDKS